MLTASDNSILLRPGYRAADRLQWNPSWRMPDSVEIDDEGFMCVWYQDGDDEIASGDAVAVKELEPLA